MDARDLAKHIVVVLHRPQKLVNIGGVVRAMKNMGLRRLRLVQAAEYNPTDIAGIAHRSESLLADIEHFSTLDDAIADATYIVGTTARPRTAAPLATPRAIAPEILRRAEAGTVALVFGPEDNGLSNVELDRCHATISVPTDPAYASLNLAQAALLVCYELRLALDVDLPPHAELSSPPSGAQLAALFAAAEAALRRIEFFKSGEADVTLRTIRQIVHRVAPDIRETALLTAISREVIRYIERQRSDDRS